MIKVLALVCIIAILTVGISSTDTKCEMSSGIGSGGDMNIWIGFVSESNCIDACLKKKQDVKSINGITRHENTGCWCEKGMTNRTIVAGYSSCFFETPDYLKRTLGTFLTSFGTAKYKYRYTVTRKRLYSTKTCCYYSWNIEQSDNQNIFPSNNGWFKGVGVNARKGYYMYFRVNKDGKLEVQYFKKGYIHKYNGLPNYLGSTGIGNRI